MKRYDSYKDSGVKWLGEIPSHWEVRKMKFTFKERSKKGFPTLPLLAATQNHGVIKKEEYEYRTVEATKSLETLKLVEVGDFVISLRSFQGGIELCHDKGIISPAYTILCPINISGSYFKHLGKSSIFIQLLKSMVTGIREGQNIDYCKLRENILPIPSAEEQESIANYLDATTSKIDKAIAQQQKMIDLLNERKQIIINNAVTKGLAPNVKMKSSGVDWIGEIPEHWEIRKVKAFGPIKSGDGIKNSELSDEGKYPVWGGNGLMGFTDRYNKDKNAIVIGRVGALCGNVRYLSIPTFVTDNALILSLSNNIDHNYLLNALIAANLNSLNTSNAQPLITGAKVKNVVIPYPPLGEQNIIVQRLNILVDHIDNAIINCNKQISLLQERKQIIINDVVTGKVKVI